MTQFGILGKWCKILHNENSLYIKIKRNRKKDNIIIMKSVWFFSAISFHGIRIKFFAFSLLYISDLQIMHLQNISICQGTCCDLFGIFRSEYNFLINNVISSLKFRYNILACIRIYINFACFLILNLHFDIILLLY